VKDVDGKNMKIANPAYETWAAQDQHVLSFLLSSLSKDILPQVTAQPIVAAAWREIEGMFSSQTRARIVNTRIVLSTTKKGDMTMVGYFAKMRQLGDEMAAAGRRLDDDELIKYILASLDYDYNPAVSAVLVRPEPISLSELYSNLLAFETPPRPYWSRVHSVLCKYGASRKGRRPCSGWSQWWPGARVSGFWSWA
jgi:hypothetical protein